MLVAWTFRRRIIVTYTWDAENRMGMGAFNAVGFNEAAFNQNGEAGEGGSFYYLFDLQSNSRLLLDAGASTSNEYLYRAFGEKVVSMGSIRNPFQFQGQVGPYFDANNRTWMGARAMRN